MRHRCMIVSIAVVAAATVTYSLRETDPFEDKPGVMLVTRETPPDVFW